jgi:DNA-binding MarR family transcriptional regulator
MEDRRTENIVGALVLALSDSLLQGVAKAAPEPGQAAAAIALLRHEPGMPIERMRRALGLSHPGTVRLVDRLVGDGLVERRPSLRDKRAVALHLTKAGETTCAAILTNRSDRVADALGKLKPADRDAFGRIAEQLLSSLIQDEEDAYSVCRLCDATACVRCPVSHALSGRTCELST